ncbi:MAG: tRNA lysidine(34) synthetase TilS [Cyanobacteria bacterium P01_F01_bin.33]
MTANHLTPLHVRVRQGLRQRGLLPDREHIVVAVSGGQDSLCLLKILADIASRHHWRLFVLHCNHRWHERETDCAHFVQTFVRRQFQLPCEIATADVVTRDENRARQWRYRELAHWAERWQCRSITTGHTCSDRAETFLYNLVRGTGVRGLTSLDWCRPLQATDSTAPLLVRPLLEVSRAETAQFCQQHHLPVWEDHFNRDLSHPRNRLRHEVIPNLKKHFNPQVDRALNRAATTLQAEADYLEIQTEILWQASYCPEPPRLLCQPLRQAHLAIQRRILHRYLQLVMTCTPTFERVEALRSLVDAPRGSRTSTLRGGWWGITDSRVINLQQHA